MSTFETLITNKEKITKTLSISINKNSVPGFFSAEYKWGNMDPSDAAVIDQIVQSGMALLKSAGVRPGGKEDISIVGELDDVIATELIMTYISQQLNDAAIVKASLDEIVLPKTEALLKVLQSKKQEEEKSVSNAVLITPEALAADPTPAK